MEYGKNIKYINIIIDKARENVIDAINLQKKGEIRHSKEALFVANTLFDPLGEIIGSIEIIDLIPTFFKTFPYKRSGMSKARYLQYHIGNYFVEIGNLNYRLELYAGKIKNAYGKIAKNKKNIELIAKTLQKYRKTVFKGLIDIRDSHVHKFRYTDKEIDRLLELELIAKYADKSKRDILLKVQHENAFKKIRKKWNSLIKENDVQIEQTLDFYFETLLKIVAPKGSIIYPFNNKKS